MPAGLRSMTGRKTTALGSLYRAMEFDAWSISSDGQTLVFFVNAGVDQIDYTILVEAVSSGGQTKEDELVVLVRDF